LLTFSTIQSAVSASPAGTTVLICPGTYPEQVVINKALTLRGVRSGTSNAAVVVAPPGGIVQNTTSLATGNPIAAQILVTETTNVSISNLTIDGVSATHIFDGIELCSSSNTVQDNTINGSDEAAIHIDSACGPVMSNVVSGNTVNDACAGIMVGTAAGSNSIGFNEFFNTRNTILTADQCTPPLNSVHRPNTSSATQTRKPSTARP
jgi:nitrous oxidase accessory protein NosD